MLSAREAAAIMGGDLIGADCTFDGVSTDTRTLGPGELFFALRGPRFDAASFVDQAFANGAVAAVVGRDAVSACAGRGTLVAVDDTRAALAALARDWRRRFTLPLVGLTGSNGKTTVKEMIAAVLAAAGGGMSDVLATAGNFNNDIGVPLTLLRLRAKHRYAVVEMGMNHAGEIRVLTQLADPSVALVTNAGIAHIGMLGSRDAIARAKGEIYEASGAGCVAVINADDAYANYWRGLNAGRRIVEFGLSTRAQVTGAYEGHALTSDIALKTPAGRADFRLYVPGEHNVRNALAAAATAVALDVPLATIAEGLQGFRAAKGRLQVKRANNGALLIDDTYNANPDSALAAIEVLAGTSGKRLLVLADMGELGEQGPELHAEVGEAARHAGIEHLFTFGELAARASQSFGARGRHFERIEDLLAAIAVELGADSVLLVKGSRFMQMERVVKSFATEEQ